MEDFLDKTILVTGGCGFIGSHLVRRLLRSGAKEIRIIDSLDMGTLANLNGCGGPLVHHKVKLGSIERDALLHLVSGVDVIFHLAAEKHNQAIDRPDDLLKANILGMHDLLECAASAGVGAVMFSSSLYAYGRLTGSPMSEDEVPTPRTLYGISKLAGEHMVHAFGQKTGIPTVCLRYFFVYGPRQYAGMGYRSVIVKNFERILKNERPIINGDGRQALDYVFVEDVVDATLASIARGRPGGTYNIGSGSATTVNELVHIMLEAANSPLEILHAPADWTAGSLRVGKNDLAREVLGWVPTTSLRTGLTSVYKWMASHHESN